MLPKDARVGTLSQNVLQEAVLAQASKPSEKRRGSWSFLTWSFFLAQTFAAEQFFGSGARAAQNDDASATRSNDQSQIPSDETTAAAAWGPGGQDAGDGRTIEGQAPLNGAQGLLFPGVSQAASDYSGAGSAGSPNGSGSDSSGGGSSSASSQPELSLADSQELGHASTIPPASEIPVSAPDDIISPLPGIDAGIDIGPDLDTDLDLELNLDPVAGAGLGLDLGLGDGTDPGLDLGLGSPLADALALETEVSLDVNLLGGDPSLDLELNLDPVAGAGLGLDLGLGDGTDLGLDLGLGSPLADGLTLDTEVSLDVSLLGEDASLDLGLEVGATSPLLNASVNPVTDLAQTGLSAADSALGDSVSVISNTTGLESLQQAGAVSSGDVIAFAGGTTPNLTDDLFAGGGYTDYGLALHTDGSPGVGNVTNSLDSDIVEEGPSSLLDKPEVDGASTQSSSSVEDNLETSHLGVPNSIDELARTDAF